MSIQYPTEMRIAGPWLLNDEALQQLDNILDEEWKRLESSRESLLTKDAEERLQYRQEQGLHKDISEGERISLINELRESASYPLRRSNRNINITLKGGGTYKAERFSTVMRDNTLLNEIATGFSTDLESADMRYRINVSSEQNELRIDVSPEQAPAAREAFVAFRQWAIKNSAPSWQRILGRFSEFGLPILIALFMGMLFSIMAINTTQDARRRAKALLEQGITQQNETEAIELLLIMRTDYDPKSSGVLIPYWFKVVFGGGLLSAIVLSIKPKTILGIGRGTKIIGRWRLWHRIVSIIIPGLLFTSFILPTIVDWIKSW
ncbi:MAG: hypothetical protein NT002_06650 [candidate division Zixibacteria bacterium]|nr:hypothetical protein [candidate division Zixibacteria bacterium]